MGEAGQGRLHGHQRRRHDSAVPRIAGRQTGRPAMIAALLHNRLIRRRVFNDLDAIAAAKARGHRLLGQVSCCPLTNDFTLASPYPFEGSQGWKPAMRPARPRCRAVSPTPISRRCRRTGVAAAFRLFNGEWHNTRAGGVAAEPTTRAGASPIARADGAIPSTSCLISPYAQDLQTVFTAAASQYRRGGGRPHAPPPKQYRQPDPCRRAPDVLLRCGLWPAFPRPLGARSGCAGR